ncbi:MAG: hypothetical protein WCX74_02170 [Candidatus Paceibacterota bacterium]
MSCHDIKNKAILFALLYAMFMVITTIFGIAAITNKTLLGGIYILVGVAAFGCGVIMFLHAFKETLNSRYALCALVVAIVWLAIAQVITPESIVTYTIVASLRVAGISIAIFLFSKHVAIVLSPS